jgi:site-specific recombinase XerD
MSTAIILAPAPELLPAPIFAPTPKAARRVAEFFTAQINNDNTRRAYLNATQRFAHWCDEKGICQLTDVQPIHVAAFVKELQEDFSAPTVKQHLAALRMLFDWLVTGHVLETNPAHAVRGPKHVVKKGKTPVLNTEEARALLDAIDTGSLVGLRDRALIGVMVYTFARINAVIEMKVEDYFIQGRRGWVRLHEKGGKEHEVPCHHNLEKFLDEYIAAAGIAEDAAGPLFRTVAGRTGQLTNNSLWQQDGYRMIQKRALTAGIKTKIGNHTFRATGITAYMKNGGSLETAQHIANHESPKTTKLYDRRRDEISLDEVERIVI